MSTAYSKAIDTSDVVLAFAEEAVWGTAPSSAYATGATNKWQQMRLTGESIAESKQRTRPQEINSTGVVSAAITTQVQADGGVNFALSASTLDGSNIIKSYEQFLTAVIGANDFAAEVTISATSVTTSTIVGTAMAVIPANTWIMVSANWTNAANTAGNNASGWYKTTNAPSTGTTITLAAGNTIPAAETVAVTVRYTPALTNGNNFRSFAFEKRLASNLFMVATGAQVTQFQLNAQVGGFVEGSFNVISRSVATATTSAATAGYVSPSAGRVISTVSGVARLWLNGAAIATPAQSFALNLTRQNARGQYAIGSPQAQGMGRGTLDVSGTISLYFNDFSMYTNYVNETAVAIEIALQDSGNGGYVISIPSATLMNPTIVAGGPDSDVLAEFQLEGNPSGGSIISVTRVRSTAT
jgi:hypothetical protein